MKKLVCFLFFAFRFFSFASAQSGVDYQDFANKIVQQQKAQQPNNNFQKNNNKDFQEQKRQPPKGFRFASNGIIYVSTCEDCAVFHDNFGNIIKGKLDDKGKFIANDKRMANGNNQNQPISKEKEKANEIINSQYKMLCNSKPEDVESAIMVSDPLILAAACVAAAQFDLDVKDRLIDLLNHDEDIVSQNARKGLKIKSFYVLSKFKRFENNRDYFMGKPTPDNFNKYTTEKVPEAGKDYVDFGPFNIGDDNLAVNSAVTRWQTWFKTNELKLNDMTKDPLKSKQ